MDKKYLTIVDLETTGVFSYNGPEGTRITEIGAVRLDLDSGEIENFSQMVNPQMEMDDEIWDFKKEKYISREDFNGITNKSLRSAHTFRKVGKDFADFIGNKESLLLSWPSVFENSILDIEYNRHGMQIPYDYKDWLCLYTMAKLFFMRTNSKVISPDGEDDPIFSLKNVCYTLGIEQVEPSHRALPDALTEYILYKGMINTFAPEKKSKIITHAD